MAGDPGGVRRLAAVLANRAGHDAATVRTRFDATIAALARHREGQGSLAEASDHFRKVTRSYRPGLFGCYDLADLPRTNNDLEQFFGSYRYHERRCSGRKVASPGTVVRGSVRLVAAATTRLGSVEEADLVPSDLAAWCRLRRGLQRRQAIRTSGRRFRRDPEAYLKSLEDKFINQALPSWFFSRDAQGLQGAEDGRRAAGDTGGLGELLQGSVVVVGDGLAKPDGGSRIEGRGATAAVRFGDG